MNLLVYIYVYKALNASTELLGFAIIGGSMVMSWLGVLWGMGNLLARARGSGMLELLLKAPISMISYLTGHAISQALDDAVPLLYTLFLSAFLFDVKLVFPNPFLTILSFSLAEASLYGLGMCFASIFILYGREAHHVANLLQEPIYFFSGFYFPTKYLPDWAGIVSSLIPLTFGLSIVRRCILLGATSINELSPDLYLLAIFAVISPFLARHLLRYMETLSKRAGRLTLT